MKDTKLQKPRKSALIKTRCIPRLKEDLERIAWLQQMDVSDAIRIACCNYVEKYKIQIQASA